MKNFLDPREINLGIFDSRMVAVDQERSHAQEK
jgi:hypothetical protein